MRLSRSVELHCDRSSLLNNLALSLRDRSKQQGILDGLDEAFHCDLSVLRSSCPSLCLRTTMQQSSLPQKSAERLRGRIAVELHNMAKVLDMRAAEWEDVLCLGGIRSPKIRDRYAAWYKLMSSLPKLSGRP
ncbi:hypothetical protein BDR07DRAFT_1403558 [Suillus spraguei]|nr:hypothetical protein BDR07DRAFT_1403558 [Suillus spraguei]